MNLYQHQIETVDFLKQHPRAFITSTPGTGKTVSVLETWHQRAEGKLLVIAPKSTLEAVWGNDIANFYPKTKVGVFNRKSARDNDYIYNLLLDNDIVVINIEAVDLVLSHLDIIDAQFTTLVVDEFTSIKNRNAQRSKKTAKLAQRFSCRYLLSGTPTPNGILDIWHPASVLDDGQRLGSNFYAFRNTVCQPVQKGYNQIFTEWEEIPGASDVVADSLRDITIRHVLEDVVDMPERIYRTLEISMPEKLRKAYDEMVSTSILQLKSKLTPSQMMDKAMKAALEGNYGLNLDENNIVAVNKAVLGNKLLQITSGSIYDTDRTGNLLDNHKYELIVDLVKERQHSLVFFIWQHQSNELAKELSKRGISFDIIDGSVSDKERARIIREYQQGKYQTLLIQPAAAAHGITLTKSEASIWCSPTWNLENFVQANYRDYRIGQKKRTEVIMIQYKDTIEQRVYEALQNKHDSLTNLLEILQT
jgi:SNF2 family DNA or RNA helicase